jgi:hypothetical protein
VGDHPQADRRREPDADGERLLEHRMARVERRHQEHAQQRRDAEVVPERRRQLHLLIVNEIRHDEGPPANGMIAHRFLQRCRPQCKRRSGYRRAVPPKGACGRAR